MAKYCGNCGTQLEDSAKVCGQCGTPLDGASLPRPKVKVIDPEIRNSLRFMGSPRYDSVWS